MQKTSTSLTSFILIIAILAIGYFGVYSFWTDLSDSRAALNISKDENSRLKQAQSDINTFLAQYNTNKSQADLINRALPLRDGDVPILLENFSKMITESGMNLLQLNVAEGSSPDAVLTPNTIQSIDVDVQMSGTYEAFKDYMLRAQRNLRLIDMITLNVAVDDKTQDNGRSLKFTARLRTYYQK